MRTLLAYALVVLVVASVAVQAQAPAGGEFRVSSATAVGDARPFIAADARGSFVVSWNERSSVPPLKARWFDPLGLPRGGQVTVTSTSYHYASNRGIASDESGRTMMVWQRSSGGAIRIHARAFDPGGAPVGSEFVVSELSPLAEHATVAAARNGAFVVAWSEFQGQGFAVVARRFGPAGNPLGAQFRVNTGAVANDPPSVATDESGGFVIVWQGVGQGIDVFGRRFDGAGLPLGAEFRVNSYTTGQQYRPEVVAGDGDAFVVIWQDWVFGPPAVVGRRFRASGLPVGAEFAVATLTSDYILPTTAAADRTGNFTVVWQHPNGNSRDVFGRRYTAQGVPRGAQFQVNTSTLPVDWYTEVAADVAGNLFVGWASGPSGVMPEIRAQRYGGLVPAGLSVSDGANGVLEVADDFSLTTSWRNVNGAAQTFQGRASNAIVPPGLTLTQSADADYGTVANDTVGACTQCFSGSLSGTRPAGHVDLSFIEGILPDAQGQAKRWRLHVGDSFSDVPRDNSFYPFVETLLHLGVTGGCAGNAYCPASSTTREQMSVLVLVAKEGAGYAPPSCTTPVFADVPPSSPFCAWVEELARRGVTSGCGGGSFCPGAAVSREQMAVFVLRALDPALDPPACEPPNTFNDVPESSAFCRWIEELARRGVVGGCGGGNFCPTAAIARDQMAVFLAGTFGLTLYGP